MLVYCLKCHEKWEIDDTVENDDSEKKDICPVCGAKAFYIKNRTRKLRIDKTRRRFPETRIDKSVEARPDKYEPPYDGG